MSNNRNPTLLRIIEAARDLGVEQGIDSLQPLGVLGVLDLNGIVDHVDQRSCRCEKAVKVTAIGIIHRLDIRHTSVSIDL